MAYITTNFDTNTITCDMSYDCHDDTYTDHLSIFFRDGDGCSIALDFDRVKDHANLNDILESITIAYEMFYLKEKSS